MKNELPEIHQRAQEIVRELMDGIPLSLYDAEMGALDKLTDELLETLGYELHSGWYRQGQLKDLKIALMNMYLLGKTYGK